jgi:hypothetical protein
LRSFSYEFVVCDDEDCIIIMKKLPGLSPPANYTDRPSDRRLSAKLVYVFTRVEAGPNTSTVTLRVVRGDEMGLKKGRAIA